MQRIKALYARYREMIAYLFFGGLTTLLSIGLFWLFGIVLQLHYTVANIISWVLCVLFAYVTNRKWVFASDGKNIPREILAFFAGRLLSLGGETLILFLCIDLLFMNELVAKIIGNVFVIIFNYIFSKWIVFRKQKKESEAEHQAPTSEDQTENQTPAAEE
jgi:putative flippase GtrA